ncbi:hypothetical protein QQG55_14380 [Brugia pahangi]|uniref:Bm8793 n=2 Tax=Brugia TaxID=6278 RepID=A0A0K0JX22_BRUMA|nr:Bm8793 [Brugia malayi]VDO24525.1 unnamed protein product [Brugia timori]
MCAPNYFPYPSGGIICGLTICPDESIFHYYYCCYGLLGACCFYLRTWLIILLMVISLSLILCAVAAAIAAFSRSRQQRIPTNVDATTNAGYDIHYHPPREHTVYYTDHSRDRSL